MSQKQKQKQSQKQKQQQGGSLASDAVTSGLTNASFHRMSAVLPPAPSMEVTPVIRMADGGAKKKKPAAKKKPAKKQGGDLQYATFLVNNDLSMPIMETANHIDVGDMSIPPSQMGSYGGAAKKPKAKPAAAKKPKAAPKPAAAKKPKAKPAAKKM
jgi:hypothetical protein